jgi:hypothetical protein
MLVDGEQDSPIVGDRGATRLNAVALFAICRRVVGVSRTTDPAELNEFCVAEHRLAMLDARIRETGPTSGSHEKALRR